MSPYKRPYSKMLGKDGILVCHEQTAMHYHVEERADLFPQNYRRPDARVDTGCLCQLMDIQRCHLVARKIKGNVDCVST